jgi:hypothetical protein
VGRHGGASRGFHRLSRLPNFLIIGAGKSGTSSLHAYLQQHPDVYMSPVKEPNFFALDGRPPNFPSERIARAVVYPQIWRLEDYVGLFVFHDGQRAVGESSSWYLNAPPAPRAIQSLVPDMRLIVVLREPVERAYSAFLMNRRIGLEPEVDFAAALARHDERQTGYDYGLDYLTPGYYARHIERYLEFFPRDQLKIELFDDLLADEGATLGRLFGFIGVDPGFRPDTSCKHNSGEAPPRQKSLCDRLEQMARRHWRKIRTGSSFAPAARRSGVAADLRRRLAEVYAPEVDRLERLIDRELPGWRSAPVFDT